MCDSASRRRLPALKHPSFRVLSWAGALGLLFGLATSAHALTPESPEVKQLAGKGVKFLETASLGKWERHPGAKALVGMCVLKHYGAKAKNHPKVVETIETIRQALKNKSIPTEEQIYNIGICLIFLLDLETEGAGECRPEMEQLLALLLAAQKPHGGFGYPGQSTGDTSQTQFGALGMWSVQTAGVAVPLDNWERLTNWLLRVQDPSGGYGYQGVDPGNFTLVAQSNLRKSLAAASLGSVCICADALNLFPPEPEEEPSSGSSKMKKVAKPRENLAKNIEIPRVTEALRRGQGYFNSNYTPDYKMSPDHLTPYYMYAFERYKSFLELIPSTSKDTKWYDDGYAHLAKTQAQDGSWVADAELTVPNTAFAVLFLYRSTQKIIQHVKSYGGGLLVGGRGLPTNASDLQLGANGLRAKPLKGPAMDLLQKLADPNDPKFEEAVRGMEEQSLVEEGDRMTEMQKRLRAMAAGKSPEARAAGLKLLGRTRDLDNVPLLIEALRDSEPLVIVAATESLQFMARKFRPAGEFGVDEEARKQAVEYWKSWYRGFRPDAVFADE